MKPTKQICFFSLFKILFSNGNTFDFKHGLESEISLFNALIEIGLTSVYVEFEKCKTTAVNRYSTLFVKNIARIQRLRRSISFTINVTKWTYLDFCLNKYDYFIAVIGCIICSW